MCNRQCRKATWGDVHSACVSGFDISIFERRDTSYRHVSGVATSHRYSRRISIWPKNSPRLHKDVLLCLHSRCICGHRCAGQSPYIQLIKVGGTQFRYWRELASLWCVGMLQTEECMQWLISVSLCCQVYTIHQWARSEDHDRLQFSYRTEMCIHLEVGTAAQTTDSMP